MKTKIILSISLFLFLGISCSKDLLEEEFKNTPTGNYDALWSEYNRNYGAFEAKKINWDSLYFVYRIKLNDQSTDQELYNAVTGLISNLNDGHVSLTASGFKQFLSCKNNLRPFFYDSGLINNTDDFKEYFHVIINNYIDIPHSGNTFIYGNINSSLTAKNVGYLYVSTFADDLYPKDAVNSAMDNFEKNDAVILDLRFNGGGATETFLHLLSRFADKKRFYIQSKLRNGPGKTDFSEIYKHSFSPRGKAFRPRPVVVLVNKFTASSSEHTLLALETLPYVTVAGDTTCGALSTVIDKVMPNGWQFRVCPQVLLDTTGKYLSDDKGRYPDGYGFAPQIRAINTLKDLNEGYDAVLKKAIDIINNIP